MELVKLLSILSKSSPYSVSTLRTGEPNSQLKAKDYLYIRSEIDIEFEQALQNAREGDLLFLSGSSGDGKSEILTKFCRKPDYNHIVFHLDATHSKTQHGTATECLDNLFDDYKTRNLILAIGINVGMMKKFMKYGAERHQDIKTLFDDYFSHRHLKGFKSRQATFFDFECYPRITFDKEAISSEFISSFLEKLTNPEHNNPFWRAYLEDERKGLIVAKNYKLLSESAVQAGIVNLLGLIRLYDEQFLVPRTFVDFIYKLIVTENQDGLIGNIFTQLDNEISEKIQLQDPLKNRSRELDDFYLAKTTNTLDQDSLACGEYLDEYAGIHLSDSGKLRLARLLVEEIRHRYPNSYFAKIPTSLEVQTYLKLHNIFNKSSLDSEDEEILITILEDGFLNTVFNYINRSLSQNINGFILANDLDYYFICNKVEAELDLEEIIKTESLEPEFLTVPFLINDNDDPVKLTLDIKLLSLVNRIENGFLPDRNLLNEYTKLDEFIRDITLAAAISEEVKIYEKSNTSDTYAEVKKGRRGYTVKGVVSGA